MILKLFTILSKIPITVNVLFLLIMVTLRIFREVFLIAKPVLPCIKTINSGTTTEPVKNSAVLSKIQNQSNIHTIINIEITVRKTVAVINTLLFRTITNFLLTVYFLPLKSCILLELKLKDTIQDLRRPVKNNFGSEDAKGLKN